MFLLTPTQPTVSKHWRQQAGAITLVNLQSNNIILPEKFYEPLYEHTHTRLTALFPGLPRWAGTRKVKPIWILLKQEKVSGIGISWDICKSAPHSRQITMPAPHRSVFYRLDALPVAQPTASKHWMSIYSKKTTAGHVQTSRYMYDCNYSHWNGLCWNIDQKVFLHMRCKNAAKITGNTVTFLMMATAQRWTELNYRQMFNKLHHTASVYIIS